MPNDFLFNDDEIGDSDEELDAADQDDGDEGREDDADESAERLSHVMEMLAARGIELPGDTDPDSFLVNLQAALMADRDGDQAAIDQEEADAELQERLGGQPLVMSHTHRGSLGNWDRRDAIEQMADRVKAKHQQAAAVDDSPQGRLIRRIARKQ